MIEIDCRKCANADLEADCCKLYGNNPDTAVRECAADEFVNYKEVGFHLMNVLEWGFNYELHFQNNGNNERIQQ